MSPTTVTLEVDSPQQGALLRHFHAFLQEMQHLALTAPEGQILDVVLRAGKNIHSDSRGCSLLGSSP